MAEFTKKQSHIITTLFQSIKSATNEKKSPPPL